MLALLGTEFQKKQRALRRLKKKKRELKHKGHLSLIGKKEVKKKEEEKIRRVQVIYYLILIVFLTKLIQ